MSGGLVIQGYDALGHPDPKLVGPGRFVCQYLKALVGPAGRAQVDAYHRSGVDVVLIYETTGRRSLGGRAAGIADAKTALAQANALGAPPTAAIYFAENDFDVTASQLPTALAYAQGVQSVMGGRAGSYGGLRIIRAIRAAKAAAYLWQTYAWSGTPTVWEPGTHLQQYLNGQRLGGTAVDLDRALVADFGAWRAPTPTGGTTRGLYQMFVFALGDDHKAAGAIRGRTVSDNLDDAKAAIAAGGVVKVLGGPAAAALGLKPGVHGNVEVIVGATYPDTFAAAAKLSL